MPRCAVLLSPIGRLVIFGDDAAVTAVQISDAPVSLCDCGAPATAARQLADYFSGKRSDFTVPLRPQGTPFQLAVWQALREIPYGKTRTYGEIAAMAGFPRAARAAGSAVGKNPCLILTPCHRVLPASGQLGHFSAPGGSRVKQFLLDLEGAGYRGGKTWVK
ncbi:MAG: methylated-DNA--[protein]-cysteine S-methyltransferase [Oscillospiraceae bacterium]|nr:methylated-DNA--[protein]-cysteine S-methyltransferase [Oscillospiraceae bacterium]